MAKANHLAHLGSYAIRPVLVEAKLLTEKHAGDAIYVATLAEELRNIEAKIAEMEEAPDIGSSAAPAQLGSGHRPEVWPDADWIRAKSRELAIRLRRVEQSSKPRQGLRNAAATNNSVERTSSATSCSHGSETV